MGLTKEKVSIDNKNSNYLGLSQTYHGIQLRMGMIRGLCMTSYIHIDIVHCYDLLFKMFCIIDKSVKLSFVYFVSFAPQDMNSH